MTEKKTPKQIVELLDKYIIGQNEAKKSVAVALYNRYRRLQLPKQMQQDITPKNMLMAGPTGVGKTEIARRLAKIVDAPFVKVEATKFTEVGYVGRDVESMVRDLVEEAVRMEEKDQFEHVKMQATKKANNSGDLRRAAVEMAQSWRKDPTLAKLQAMVIAFNDKDLLLISGNGEVLEPDEDVVAIGSGGNFAQAAAIAMTRHSNGMSASEIAKEAVKIASGIDVFTDDHITIDEI